MWFSANEKANLPIFVILCLINSISILEENENFDSLWCYREYSKFNIVFCFISFKVLNLFLALLLSSFGGDALNSGESPDDDRPDLEPIKENKTRIQQLVEWTKKRKRKKKKKKEKLNNSETEVVWFFLISNILAWHSLDSCFYISMDFNPQITFGHFNRIYRELFLHQLI